jgi:predicted phosphate transport protein (TIGR00153 family)
MFGLLPRNLEFFDCFESAARNAVRTAELLAEFSAASAVHRRELVMAIMESEHAGDKLTHETLNRLEQTYLTPIDRDDIHRLISKIDDVVDAMDAVATRIMFYKIESITPDFQNQCQVLVKASRCMADAVAGLRNLKGRGKRGNGPKIEESIIAVHAAEEEADEIHHRFLGELFESGLDAFGVIKWKELYETVEHAIDLTDDVANIVHGIVLKNV